METLEAKRKAAVEDMDMDLASQVARDQAVLQMQLREIDRDRSNQQANTQAQAAYEAQQSFRARVSQEAQAMVAEYPDLVNPQSALAVAVEAERSALEQANSPLLQDPAYVRFITRAKAAELGVQRPGTPPPGGHQAAAHNSPFAAYQQPGHQPRQPTPVPLAGSTPTTTPRTVEDLILASASGQVSLSEEDEGALLNQAWGLR